LPGSAGRADFSAAHQATARYVSRWLGILVADVIAIVMKTNRIIAAFAWYAAVGLLLGASLEGVGISLEKGDVTLDQLATGNKQQSRQHFQRVLDNTVAAAKDIRFWILPILLAAGLGAFFAHTEYKDGTAFHFDNKCDPACETYGDY
jgi:hypothetical protein